MVFMKPSTTCSLSFCILSKSIFDRIPLKVSSLLITEYWDHEVSILQGSSTFSLFELRSPSLFWHAVSEQMFHLTNYIWESQIYQLFRKVVICWCQTLYRIKFSDSTSLEAKVCQERELCSVEWNDEDFRFLSAEKLLLTRLRNGTRSLSFRNHLWKRTISASVKNSWVAEKNLTDQQNLAANVGAGEEGEGA